MLKLYHITSESSKTSSGFFHLALQALLLLHSPVFLMDDLTVHPACLNLFSSSEHDFQSMPVLTVWALSAFEKGSTRISPAFS